MVHGLFIPKAWADSDEIVLLKPLVLRPTLREGGSGLLPRCASGSARRANSSPLYSLASRTRCSAYSEPLVELQRQK